MISGTWSLALCSDGDPLHRRRNRASVARLNVRCARLLLLMPYAQHSNSTEYMHIIMFMYICIIMYHVHMHHRHTSQGLPKSRR